MACFHSHCLWVAVCVTLLNFWYLQSFAATTAPGFRAAVTSKGFQYLKDVGVPLLKEELSTLKIPDQSGKADIKIGKLKYKLNNIRLTELEIGSSSLSSSPGKGLSFQATSISLEVSADWSYKSWIASDHGSVKGSAGGISLSVSILVGANDKGQPNVTCTGCSFNVGHLSVKLSGGASWLYNLFNGVFEKQIKKALDDKMCDLASSSINKAANRALSTLPVVIPLDNVAELNYALLRQPNYTSWFIMTDHKGEFLSVTQPNIATPFTPAPLPPLPPSSEAECRMVYLWATDYIANTAALVYMQAGFLRYNVTPDMVDHLGPFFKLDTTTFSLLVPELYHRYPNKNMTLGIRANKPPFVNIHPEGADFNISGAIDFYVIDGRDLPLAFTLGIMASVDVNISLVEDRKTNQLIVRANATTLHARLSILASNVGTIDVKKIQGLFDAVSNSVLLPQINKLANHGFPIPNVEGLKFIRPSLTLGKGYVVVDTDVSYDV